VYSVQYNELIKLKVKIKLKDTALHHLKIYQCSFNPVSFNAEGWNFLGQFLQILS